MCLTSYGWKKSRIVWWWMYNSRRSTSIFIFFICWLNFVGCLRDNNVVLRLFDYVLKLVMIIILSVILFSCIRIRIPAIWTLFSCLWLRTWIYIVSPCTNSFKTNLLRMVILFVGIWCFEIELVSSLSSMLWWIASLWRVQVVSLNCVVHSFLVQSICYNWRTSSLHLWTTNDNLVVANRLH